MTGELGRGDQIMMVEGKTFIDISRPIAEKFLQKCMDSPEVNINLQSGSPITPPPLPFQWLWQLLFLSLPFHSLHIHWTWSFWLLWCWPLQIVIIKSFFIQILRKYNKINKRKYIKPHDTMLASLRPTVNWPYIRLFGRLGLFSKVIIMKSQNS